VPRWRHGIAHPQPAVSLFRILCLQNGIGAFGQRRTCHDPNGLSRLHAAGIWPAGKSLTDHGEFERIVRSSAKCLRAAQCVTVHRRTVERWNRNVRDDIGSQDAPGSRMQPDRF
jgi:hypothetical protein